MCLVFDEKQQSLFWESLGTIAVIAAFYGQHPASTHCTFLVWLVSALLYETHENKKTKTAVHHCLSVCACRWLWKIATIRELPNMLWIDIDMDEGCSSSFWKFEQIECSAIVWISNCHGWPPKTSNFAPSFQSTLKCATHQPLQTTTVLTSEKTPLNCQYIPIELQEVAIN